MNGKQAKRLRGVIRRVTGKRATDKSGVAYTTALVDSDKFSVTIQGDGSNEPSTHENKALLVRLTPGVPRQLYQDLKIHVQSDRRGQ